jgi:hypothetical protein
MPDRCDDRLTVVGFAEERRRLAQLWKDANGSDDKGVFDRILPTPDPFSDQDLAELRREVERSCTSLASWKDPMPTTPRITGTTSTGGRSGT